MAPDQATLPVQGAARNEAAARLLDSYQPGSFFFATGQHTLLASGTRRVLGGPGQDAAGQDRAGPDGTGLPAVAAEVTVAAAEVTAALAAVAGREPGRPPVAVGALPFGEDAPPRLVIPETVTWAGPLGAAPPGGRPGRGTGPGTAPAPGPAPAIRDVTEIPDRDGYLAGVRAALARIEAGGLSKVVLARSLRVALDGPADVRVMLRALARRDPYGYTYAAGLPAAGALPAAGPDAAAPGHRILAGASPELLVARTGLLVTSNPLAGSAPRHPDPAEDEARGAALLASAKDRHEHAIVVDAVARALRPYCRVLEVPAAPRLTRTAAMWHLSTPVTGWLADPDVSVLTLVRALHPTPAVCGVPEDAARRAIGEIEPFRRGYYAGTVGWCDANGDGEWTVAIRSAEIETRSESEPGSGGAILRLFAGAGIVADSVPAAEFDETSAKFGTLLAALGMR